VRSIPAAEVQENDPMREFFRRFLPFPPGPQGEGGPDFHSRGQGSGFIISADGYVLTNAHVVSGTDQVTVRLADSKREFNAKVIGADRRTDVALLKVDATGLPTVAIGSSADVDVGDWVAAIGSPFGFDNTITAGIVSAKERDFPRESFVPFIQTDVAINPGNSGGPLLALDGKAVGINSMIYSHTGGYMGVSFAVPIEVAMDVADQLRTKGTVTRGRIGVSIQTITPELARSFGIEDKSGVLVAGVEHDGPAGSAGVRAGDIIRRYNGEPIDNGTELLRLVAATHPGARAKLELWRDGRSREVAVKVGEIPPDTTTAQRGSDEASKSAANRLGLVVRELSALERKSMKVTSGIVVESVTTAAAADTPIRRGDVITAVGPTAVTGVEQFNDILKKQKSGSSVPLLVRRGAVALFVPVQVARG
jgi:serine protease Do